MLQYMKSMIGPWLPKRLKTMGKPQENGGLVGFDGGDLMGIYHDLPSGKRLHGWLENHHAIHGKTHEISTGP